MDFFLYLCRLNYDHGQSIHDHPQALPEHQEERCLLLVCRRPRRRGQTAVFLLLFLLIIGVIGVIGVVGVIGKNQIKL